jgi:hypothetical protein
MDWSPYMVGATMTLLAAFLTAFGYIFRTLGRVSEGVAVLVEHSKATDAGILDGRKAHDEIIYLKLASAELDQLTKTHSTEIHDLKKRIDTYHAR